MQNILKQIGDKLKILINSTRIPSLLSFIITKDGKINPTLEQSLNEAAPSDTNWTRLGLDKSVFGLPVWFILLAPFVVIAIRYGSEALQFLINVASQGLVVAILGAIGYFIYKSFKK